MFKDKTFKCRVCDSCGKIVEIPGLEDFPAEELYEVKNLKTGSVDEICGDCMDEKAFTCNMCCDSFYNIDKFTFDVSYCPECAEKEIENLQKEYFDFIGRIKTWKEKRNEVKNNEF